jgi:hypothetical protein
VSRICSNVRRRGETPAGRRDYDTHIRNALYKDGVYEHYKLEGVIEGREEGRAEGRAEGREVVREEYVDARPVSRLPGGREPPPSET